MLLKKTWWDPNIALDSSISFDGTFDCDLPGVLGADDDDDDDDVDDDEPVVIADNAVAVVGVELVTTMTFDALTGVIDVAADAVVDDGVAFLIGNDVDVTIGFASVCACCHRFKLKTTTTNG